MEPGVQLVARGESFDDVAGNQDGSDVRKREGRDTSMMYSSQVLV